MPLTCPHLPSYLSWFPSLHPFYLVYSLLSWLLPVFLHILHPRSCFTCLLPPSLLPLSLFAFLTPCLPCPCLLSSFFTSSCFCSLSLLPIFLVPVCCLLSLLVSVFLHCPHSLSSLSLSVVFLLCFFLSFFPFLTATLPCLSLLASFIASPLVFCPCYFFLSIFFPPSSFSSIISFLFFLLCFPFSSLLHP